MLAYDSSFCSMKGLGVSLLPLKEMLHLTIYNRSLGTLISISLSPPHSGADPGVVWVVQSNPLYWHMPFLTETLVDKHRSLILSCIDLWSVPGRMSTILQHCNIFALLYLCPGSSQLTQAVEHTAKTYDDIGEMIAEQVCTKNDARW